MNFPFAYLAENDKNVYQQKLPIFSWRQLWAMKPRSALLHLLRVETVSSNHTHYYSVWSSLTLWGEQDGVAITPSVICMYTEDWRTSLPKVTQKNKNPGLLACPVIQAVLESQNLAAAAARQNLKCTIRKKLLEDIVMKPSLAWYTHRLFDLSLVNRSFYPTHCLDQSQLAED